MRDLLGNGFVERSTWLEGKERDRCPECAGKRFSDEILSARYRGKSIADVLYASVHEASEFFIHHRKLHAILSALEEVGLGYLELGRDVSMMSGGERLRMKLALALSKRHMQPESKLWFLLDEPSAGLHPMDQLRVLHSLLRLKSEGLGIVLAEHSPEFLLQADHIFEIGPTGLLSSPGSNMSESQEKSELATEIVCRYEKITKNFR